MKLIIKNEEIILEEINVNDITDELNNKLQELYYNKPIKKYEMIFNDGLFVKDTVEGLSDISDEKIFAHIITIK